MHIFPIPAFLSQVSLSIMNPSQALWLATIGYAALGRAVKFFAVGFIFYYFGKTLEDFVTSYLSIIFGIIAVILFLVCYIRKK